MIQMRDNLVGNIYGRLTVLEYVGKTKGRSSIWKCICECGEEVNILGRSLKAGATKSCGCLNRDTRTKHGWSKTYEYEAWLNMKSRCYNLKNKSYKDYGERGIIVCNRWIDEKEGFYNFIEDMGLRPEDTSLDRINVEGDYTPENCRWADDGEQVRNQRVRSSNKSGVRGACFRERNLKWYTKITVDGKTIYLGEFQTIEEAAIARVQAELKYFGKTYNSVREDIWDKVKHIFEENSDEE